MPAVLVEVGFISNPVEQTALKSDEYKDKIAGALLRSILEFKRTFDRK
jgi:N-acetylmuramoyl-L-alanine amidase